MGLDTLLWPFGGRSGGDGGAIRPWLGRPPAKPKAPGYPPVPSLVDPVIWAAGTPAARRTPPASGQPQGLAWTSTKMQAWMPGLIGAPG
jgi:hypothetical protein